MVPYVSRPKACSICEKCKKCRKRAKRMRISPSPPPPRTRPPRRHDPNFNVEIPPETVHLTGDIRVPVRLHFLELLNSIQDRRRKKFKSVPWRKLSKVLISRRQRLIDWPFNFAFNDSMAVSKLTMKQCKRMLNVKILSWNKDEISAYKDHAESSKHIALVIDVDGADVAEVGDFEH